MSLAALFPLKDPKPELKFRGAQHCWFSSLAAVQMLVSSFCYSSSNFWAGGLTEQPKLVSNSGCLALLALQVWLPHLLPNSRFSNIFVCVWYRLYYTQISWYIALFYSNMFATLSKLLWKMNGNVGSASEGTCRQAWQPEFSPQGRVVEGKSEFLQVVLWPPRVCMAFVHLHTCLYTHSK